MFSAYTFVFFFSKVYHIYRIMYNTGATFIVSFTKEVRANRQAKSTIESSTEN
jgi:hypothetical protein